MHIGFSGTQLGMTAVQKAALAEQLLRLQKRGAAWLHHGDCVGADAEAHMIARKLGFKIHLHPPEIWRKRAFCSFVDEQEMPKAYLIRNHDIVDKTSLLIVAPKSRVEELRSGTWATARYAEKQHKPVIYLWPTEGK